MSSERKPRAQRTARLIISALCVLVAWLGHASVRAAEAQWHLLRTREGITSWEAERSNQPLSMFRARMQLDADVWTPMAILEDVQRACEWTSHCAEMRTLRQLSERELLVYARMDAPWPVRDRDVIVSVELKYGDVGELFVSIAEQTSARPDSPGGVIRMPHFRAHYHFRALAARRTHVEYQIDVDPGGTLPDWLKQMIARDLAHNTLADLRKRVHWALAQGKYAAQRRQLATRARQQGYRAPAFDALTAHTP